MKPAWQKLLRAWPDAPADLAFSGLVMLGVLWWWL